MKRFIVIEKMDPNYPTIVMYDDGFPKIFDSYEEAEAEVKECQDGLIVEI